MLTLYKVFCHDLSSPIQETPAPAGFENGQVPFVLPTVEVDTSYRECGRGWNACRKASTALSIAHLWNDRETNRLFKVEVDEAVAIERGHKVRFPTGTIVEEITDFTDAITELCEPFDESIRAGLVNEIKLWQRAFQPRAEAPDCAKIESCLRAALDCRGLSGWTVKKYDSEKAAWDAWEAKKARDTRGTWDVWDARDARAASDAWAARAFGDVWDARAAWATIWDVRNALDVWVAGSMGWTAHDPMLLTVGVRDALASGMDGVLVTGDKEIGYWV